MNTDCIKWSRFTDAEKRYLVENYSIIGGTHCAKYLNRSRSSVNKNAKRLGLTLNQSKIMLYVNRQRPDEDFNVNPKPFIDVTKMTEHHAYLLGFLWADGHVSFCGTGCCISAVFLKDDGKQLIPIFQKTGKWNVYHVKRQKTGKPCVTIQTNNRRLAEWLKEHGYTSKSNQSALPILNHIPKHLQRHWWRGCFDGDGSFYVGKKYGQVILYSSYEQDWSHFNHLCNNLDIRYKIMKRITPRGKSSECRVFYKEGVNRLCHYLYPRLFEFGLHRKFIQSKELVSRCITPQ